MMRRKNLERAIVLGLLLSTSVYGSVWAEDIEMETQQGTLNIDLTGDNLIISGNRTGLEFDGVVDIKKDENGNGGKLTINVTGGGSNGIAAYWNDNAVLTVFADEIDITSGNNGLATLPENTSHASIILGSEERKIQSLIINAGGQGIDNKNGNVYVYGADDSIIKITSHHTAGTSKKQSAINNSKYKGAVTISGGQIELYANQGMADGITNSSGITTLNSNKVIINAKTSGIQNSSGTVNLNTINSNIIEGEENGVYSTSSGTINVIANSNTVTSSGNGIFAKNGIVKVTSGANNTINAGTIIENAENKNILYGDSLGVKAGNESKLGNLDLSTSGIVNLISNNGYNYISGAVYANIEGTNVSIKGADNNISENYVYSAAVIDGAGDIDTINQYVDEENKVENKFKDKKFVSSLYAEDGAHIELTGENHIGTWANNEDENTLERTVWAYRQDDDIASTIKIIGAAQIGTDRYETSPNSADIAIAAGTATDLNKNKVDNFNGERSTVTVEYDNFADGSISSISGDILSAYAGQVDISSNNDEARINVNGNLLAGNNGILNIDLGNGGYFEGRTDDYQDAGTATDASTVANDKHLEFYDPAFSSTIYSSGQVNLDMGTGSRWNVTGQSWVTSLSGEGIIDMRNDNAGLSTASTEITTGNNSHAVHIGKLTGKNTFVMDLNDTNHNISDMLYIKDEANSGGTHTVFLNSVEGFEDMEDGDKLRFATVNAGADKLTFVGEYNGENGYTGGRSRAMLYNVGFNDIAFEIKNETYSTSDTENSGYNGTEFGEEKPGNEYVDAEYGNDATNWYLTRNSSGDETSDAGKTMLNMSRANYSNAIYMDRLNKRLGEARYINDDPEEDEGMWVRIRHDRIGKEDAFRSQNTMYELGYDKRQECDNGKRRVGFAVDYMHGDTGYSDIAGKGEIDRYGLWLYDTWTGNKGHYADYVAKWGHLQNDFEVYTMTGGEKVTGDYSNNVFSISAEYGRKKDMGNDWYIEPQAQLQLARVTGADYTTSQGTKVSVDGINSLIGRAGFRLGKDFGEEKQSTVYFKADVLHEFLGDQTIRAMDGTTNGWQTVDYENKGTWYDIGIGYAAMLSQSTYAFIDLEQSFGNDNDDTYQINAGVRWTF